MAHFHDLAALGDELADELQENTDDLDHFFVIAMTGDEGGMSHGAEGGDVTTLWGFELCVGSILTPMEKDHDPVTVKHKFWLPPTSAIALIRSLAIWLDHYGEHHMLDDDMYGELALQMIREEASEWED